MCCVWLMMIIGMSLQNITPFFRLEPLLYEIMKDEKTLASSYLDWMEFTGLYDCYEQNKTKNATRHQNTVDQKEPEEICQWAL